MDELLLWYFYSYLGFCNEDDGRNSPFSLNMALYFVYGVLK